MKGIVEKRNAGCKTMGLESRLAP